MKEVRLLSIASTAHIVDAYHKICEALESNGYKVLHLGIDTDKWYQGNAKISYEKYNYEVKSLPRPSQKTTSWWTTHNIGAEANNSLTTISSFLEEVVSDFSPDCFLIADDTGPFEVFMIQTLELKDVNVVLLEHGPGFSFSHPSNLIFSTKLRRFIRFLSIKKIASKAKNSILFKKVFSNENLELSQTKKSGRLPNVGYFGTNGTPLVCSYSKLTHKILLEKHGVPSDRLFATGFPAYDESVRLRDTSLVRRRRVDLVDTKPKILFVSTGWSMFGDSKNANLYYKILISYISQIQHSFDVSLRLKPGEYLDALSDGSVLRDLQELKIDFDDNQVPFEQSVLNYDLVIGEASETLIKSVILGIPVILIKYRSENYKLSMASMLGEYLKVAVLRTKTSDVVKTIDNALSSEYSFNLQNQLIKNQDLLFNKLDGKSAHRVSQVIEKTLVNRFH